VLSKLGIRSVGDFARLPPGEVLQRFGSHVHRLPCFGRPT
jgi:hypothetical protein